MKASITYGESLQLKDSHYIDVRSEKEFEDHHIPGATNIPILNNQEREEVGRIYKYDSQEKAKKYGVELVSRKLPQIYDRILERTSGHHAILYCKGGGFRSTTLVSLLQALKEPVWQLEGGYKAYRHYILDQLPKLVDDLIFITLNGYTGVGKTEILSAIQNLQGQVLDLEALANHRGSCFGAIGFDQRVSQKMFDSLLFEALSDFYPGPVFIESESRLIGHIHVPETLYQAYHETNHQVLIEASLESRIQRIYDDYVQVDHNEFQEELIEALASIKNYIGPRAYQEIYRDINQRDYSSVIESLIVRYYDQRYAISQKKQILSINNINSDKTAKLLMERFTKTEL